MAQPAREQELAGVESTPSIDAVDPEEMEDETAVDDADVEDMTSRPLAYRFAPLRIRRRHVPVLQEPAAHARCVASIQAKPFGQARVITAYKRRGPWLWVWWDGRFGWVDTANLEPRCGWTAELVSGDADPREAWPGDNYLGPRGRFVLGPDVGGFAATNAMTTLPTLVVFFSTMASPELLCGGRRGLWLALRAGLAAIYATCVFLLWRAALTEPGVLPRNPPDAKPSLPPGCADAPDLKICHTCNLVRPARSKHCGSCNNCVELFDHHCPWLGTCVARRNYAYFALFLHCEVLLIIYVGCVTALRFATAYASSRRDDPGETVGGFVDHLVEDATWPLGAAAVAVGLAFPVVSLLAFHLRLAAIAQTTNESVRGVYRHAPNRHDRGCRRNCWAALDLALCQKIPPSRLAALFRRTAPGGYGSVAREPAP
mmetsp:Transcript_27954/g.86444  ORF Transcript_27954/g.86444 Transcript_27954/m.86444 type:complete len:429 (+) Transcript_27954:280-1566(+)